MSARPRFSAFVLLVALVLAGCSGGGGEKNAGEAAQKGGSPSVDLPDEGPLLLVGEDGRLSVIEPIESKPVPLDVPAVSPGPGGVAVRARGIAFFTTEDGALMMVDAFARTAKVVGNLEEAGGSLRSRPYHGGGRRFVAFTNEYGSKGLIVDIQAGTSRPLSDFQPTGEDDIVVGDVRIASNEQFLFVAANSEIRLVPLRDGLSGAGAGRAIPAAAAYFNSDGTALFTEEPTDKPAPEVGAWQRVRRIPLDGAGEEVLAEKADSFLGVAGDAALIREGDAYSLTSHPGDGRKVDFRLAEGEIAFLGWNPVDGGGLAIISNEDDREQRYAYLDAKTGAVKHLDALDGYRPASPEPTKRFFAVSNIRLPEDPGKDEDGEGGDDRGSTTTTRLGYGQYAVVDLMTGEFRTGTFDLGTFQRDVVPVPSPDGKQLAVHHANEKGETEVEIIYLGEKKSAGLRNVGFRGWSPSGKQWLGARVNESDKTLHHLIVNGGLNSEIAPGLRHVVWTAR